MQQNYDRVRALLAACCRRSGRDPASASLLAVSKTHPADAVLGLAALGQRMFGENYLQEALDKMRTCEAERPELSLEWHFIGPVQSNKTRPIAENFAWVHSVDREKIARRLSEQRPAGRPALNVCLQVNVSGEGSKSGCAPGEVRALARQVAALPGLTLRGLMAIPEPTDDMTLQRTRFAGLRGLLEQLRSDGLEVDTLSMGMSADLEAAIAEGATIVRVGTALFGPRDYGPRGADPAR